MLHARDCTPEWVLQVVHEVVADVLYIMAVELTPGCMYAPIALHTLQIVVKHQ